MGKTNDTVVIVYTIKEGGYHHFEKYYLTETLTKEKIETYIDNWNKSEKQSTIAKLYDDEMFVSLVEDVDATKTFNAFIDDLKDYCSNMDDAAQRISYGANELKEFLEDVQDDSQRYKKALEDVKNKLNELTDCGKLLGDGDEIVSDCFTIIANALEE